MALTPCQMLIAMDGKVVQEELEFLLQTVDVQEISNKMKQHNVKRKKQIFEKWQQILQKIIDSCDE